MTRRISFKQGCFLRRLLNWSKCFGEEEFNMSLFRSLFGNTRNLFKKKEIRHPRLFCAKFSGNLPYCTGQEGENLENLQTD